MPADLGLPEGAERIWSAEPAFARYPAPVAPHGGDADVVNPVAGTVARSVHRLPAEATTAAALRDIESALSAQGYETTLRCVDAECGGLPFRAALWLAPFPHMRASIADLAQLTMRREDDIVSVLISRSGEAVRVQTVAVTDARADPVVANAPDLLTSETAEGPGSESGIEGASGAAPPLPSDPPRLVGDPAPVEGPDAIGAALDAQGQAVLNGLDFEPGSLTFTAGSNQALDRAAAALTARPDLPVAVVGHTDAIGGLAPNLRIGELRAQAVVDALVARGVSADRLEAHGAAWLAPRASNDDAEGRARNRRVALVARPVPQEQ
jgi:OOP family OmpA-OmpF porin